MWNPLDNSLSYVDILSGALFIHRDLGDGSQFEEYSLSSKLGAALPIGINSYLVLIQEGIFLFEPPSELRLVSRYPLGGMELRPNDAKIGPDGALWFSLMAIDEAPNEGSLWKFDGRKHTLILEGLTIPNGLDWLDDIFFFVDGPTPEIRRYLFDATGIIKQYPSIPSPATPDGLTLDAVGRLWVAHWGAHQVSQTNLNPTKESILHDVHEKFPTSIAISGGESPRMFVTVACHDCFSKLGPGHLHQHSGGVFVSESKTRGRRPYMPRFNTHAP